MKIGIVGSGGVGGYFGARLASADHDVSFLTTSRHSTQLNSGGIRVKSFLGDFAAKVRASTEPTILKNCEMILITVKSWQVPKIAESIAPHVDSNTTIVPLQNGVTAAEELTACLDQRVIGGTCKIVSYIETPGVIKHIGVEPWIAVGELNGGHSERITKIVQLFKSVGLNAEASPNIVATAWEKFLFITAWSTVGALTRRPIGELRTFAPSRQLLVKIMEEIQATARAMKIELPASIVKKTLDFIDARQPDNTASMQRDILEGRPSELEAQTGAALRLAQKMNIPCPALEFAYATLALQDRAARQPPATDLRAG